MNKDGKLNNTDRDKLENILEGLTEINKSNEIDRLKNKNKRVGGRVTLFVQSTGDSSTRFNDDGTTILGEILGKGELINWANKCRICVVIMDDGVIHQWPSSYVKFDT